MIEEHCLGVVGLLCIREHFKLLEPSYFHWKLRKAIFRVNSDSGRPTRLPVHAAYTFAFAQGLKQLLARSA